MLVGLRHSGLKEIAVFVAVHRRHRDIAVQAIVGRDGRPENGLAIDLGEAAFSCLNRTTIAKPRGVCCAEYRCFR